MNSEVKLPVFKFINAIPDQNFEDNGQVPLEIYLQSLQFLIIHLPVGNVEIKIHVTAKSGGTTLTCVFYGFLESCQANARMRIS